MSGSAGELLGIMSDSHGRFARVRRAVQLFDRLGVAEIIHCGDVGGMEVLDELVGRRCRFVWGNTDVSDQGIGAYLSTVGLPEPGPAPLAVESGRKRILVFHGHEPTFRSAIATQAADYVLHGHTHVPRDERIGGVRVINPGALHRARIHSVATLDPVADVVEFYDIDGSRAV
jgi:putative phosphoesterase